MVIHDEAVRSRFREMSHDGKITCSVCLQLGDELGIDKKEIGAMLTEMNIKIINCQIGCFP